MIHETRERIALKSAYAYCDICQKQARHPMRLDILNIRKGEPDRVSLLEGEPYDAIPPLSADTLRSHLESLGWRIETIHGKEFLVCADCAVKDSVAADVTERSTGARKRNK